ncbi:hypothetical protein KP509_09G001900 [Ceratopteris richardii]|uniref:Uncharacterized protein n=1 Tax=Ceratopteris richardii TaxID=49495 RepID=A0A8T2U3X3_CERRI|nr:hypothetical protein KP509_09G001900 [Ceratopteris richardii]
MDISSLALRPTRAAMGLSVLSTALPSASSTSLSVPSFSVITSDLLHRSTMSVSTCTSGALPVPRLLSQKPLHFQAPPSSKLRCYGSNVMSLIACLGYMLFIFNRRSLCCLLHSVQVAEDAKRKFAETASDVEKSSKEMGGKAREHAEGMADEPKRRTEAVKGEAAQKGEQAKSRAGELSEGLQRKTKETKESAEEATEHGKEKAKGIAESAKVKAGDLREGVEEVMSGALDKAKQAGEKFGEAAERGKETLYGGKDRVMDMTTGS